MGFVFINKIALRGSFNETKKIDLQICRKLVGKCSPGMQASTLYMHHYLIYIFTTPVRDILNSHQGFIFYQTRSG